MFLAVDIGNSAIKFGVFDGEKLTSKFSIPTKRDATADEIRLAVGDRLSDSIDNSIVCSVVPGIERSLEEFLRSATNADPVFLDNSFDFGLRINYEPLAALGTDRLVNAFGAVEKYGAPSIVCSFGTATTIDVVTAEHEFIGGIIAPGLEAMAEALHLKAPRLPMIDVTRSYELIGNTSYDCVGSGIVNGYVSMVEGLITRVRSDSGISRIVGTGGNSERLSDALAGMVTMDSDLMLDGLRGLLDGR